VLARIGLASLISVLCGVLVAGLALPVIGGVGLLAKAGADDFMDLPTELAVPPLATRTTALAADGSLLATFYAVDRVSVTFEQIPVPMRQAIVAIEDSRFYEHKGVDVKGTIRAAVTNAQSGSVAQGGSTLTQQYVKNVLIELAGNDKDAQKAAVEESADRKLREARYALALEKKLSKDEILHRYLEIAYFGNGVYGVGTAANFYFKKPVEQLTLPEAAELAGMVQNPSRFNPVSADPALRADTLERRNTVLGRMRDLGNITPAQFAEASATPLPDVKPDKTQRDCDAPEVTAPFFCDYLLNELSNTDVGKALGGTVQARQDRIFRGGLTIHTSLDPKVQLAAQTAVDQKLPRTDPSGAVAATDVVEPGTGLIKAMAVNRQYGDQSIAGATKVNFANGGKAGMQAGSTFKVFTLTAALEMGMAENTAINSPAKYTSPVFKNGPLPYEPRNAGDSESGVFDMVSGTAHSVNTYFIQLAERTGLDAPYSLAERLGIQRNKLGKYGPLDRGVPSGVIGAFEVSPLAMAGAYATFAARGVYCPPRAVVSIESPSGPIAVPANPCSQAVPQGVADTVTDVLTHTITSGTASRNGQLGRPAAGKTGTTNDSTAAWFIGFTPQLTTAVWVGKSTPAPLKGKIAGVTYKQLYGGDLPTQIWKQTMQGALEGVPAKDFPPADPAVVKGQTSPVPDVTGKSYAEAAAIITRAGFYPSPGSAANSLLPAGATVTTSPGPGAPAGVKATVFVIPSTGIPDPAVPPVDPNAPPPDPNAPVVPPAGTTPTG
jgi:membrane peptidoglycan carboxypeptidase